MGQYQPMCAICHEPESFPDCGGGDCSSCDQIACEECLIACAGCNVSADQTSSTKWDDPSRVCIDCRSRCEACHNDKRLAGEDYFPQFHKRCLKRHKRVCNGSHRMHMVLKSAEKRLLEFDGGKKLEMAQARLLAAKERRDDPSLGKITKARCRKAANAEVEFALRGVDEVENMVLLLTKDMDRAEQEFLDDDSPHLVLVKKKKVMTGKEGKTGEVKVATSPESMIEGDLKNGQGASGAEVKGVLMVAGDIKKEQNKMIDKGKVEIMIASNVKVEDLPQEK